MHVQYDIRWSTSQPKQLARCKGAVALAEALAQNDALETLGLRCAQLATCSTSVSLLQSCRLHILLNKLSNTKIVTTQQQNHPWRTT
eukprot:scaffold105018_cov37-Prasinocladus_malaysianus.AAC.1